MKKQLTDPTIKFFISAIGLFILFFVLKELRHIFIPFVIAYVLFFIYEPLNQYLIKKKLPLSFLILLNILITIFLFGGIAKLVIDALVQFADKIPQYENELNKLISSTAVSLGIHDQSLINFKLSEILKAFDYSNLAAGIFSSTLDVFTNIFLILFFFIFISGGHDKIFEAIRLRYVERNVKNTIKKMRKVLQQKEEKLHQDHHTIDEELATITIQREMKLRKTFKDITQQIQKYIVTKFLISLSVGIIVGLILWFFEIEFFIVWGAFAFLLNFIPNIGSVIAVAMPALMTLIQYGSFGYMLLVLVILIVVQNLIGNILEPKIFGNRLGLNPIVILLSLMLWGYLWGIIGMFLSVPLTAVLKIIISNSKSNNMRFIANLMSN